MKVTTDVVIIGGGIVGSMLAYELRKTGKQVVVVERGEAGKQASSAATGMLAPFKLYAKPDNRYLTLQRESMALFPALAKNLRDDTGIDIGYRETGTIRIAQERQQKKLEFWISLWNALGVEMDILSPEALHKVEPGLSDAYPLAVAIPSEPQLEPVSFVQAVLAAARKSGTLFLEECEIVQAEQGGQRLLTADGDTLLCDQVVIAAGCWSGEVGRVFGLNIPVTPAQGQSISVRQPAEPIGHLIFGEGIYIAPKREGHLIIGSITTDEGFAQNVKKESIAKLFQTAKKMFPALREEDILLSWVGLKPGTLDHQPILGKTSLEHVFVATGHNGFGLLLSAITAQTISDLLVSGSVPPSIQPFGLERTSLFREAA